MVGWRAGVVAALAAWVVQHDVYDPRLSLAGNAVEWFHDVVFRTWARMPPRSDRELARYRSYFGAALSSVPLFPGLESIEMVVPAEDDGREIPVFVVRPEGPAADRHELRPIVVNFHPGGFVIGNRHDASMYQWALDLDAVFVSVEYRLAPEHKFPAGVNDCWEVVKWVHKHAAELGGDKERMGVSGSSAGGNLAAVIALRAHDEGLPLKGHLSLVPMIQFGSPTKSAGEFHFSSLSGAGLLWFWTQYVEKPSDCHHRYCQPLLAETLHGVSPGVLVVASHDPLRDEGLAYAQRLEADGVRVDLVTVQGTHVSSLVLNSGQVREASLLFKNLLNN